MVLKRVLLCLSLFLSLFVLVSHLATAIDCAGDPPSSEGDLNEYIKTCQAKIVDLRSQQATLKSALDLLTSKINLTQAQIKDTNIQIANLEKDIGTLTTVIADLNVELGKLTSVFVARVRESYKDRDTSPLILFFATKDYNTFQSRLKILQLAQRRDQIILTQLETARVDFDQQKTLKEQKQAEIEKLKAKLEIQKLSLNDQKTQKNSLLVSTQNDEKKYQQLLADAKAQLAAFNKFVSNQGGATILTGTTKEDSGWGTYYNQRDSQWGNRSLGISGISVADAGCLITSMSMVMTHYGKTVTPGDIAGNSSFFSPYYPYADFLQGTLNINGASTNRTRVGYSQSSLDSELSSGKPVIVGVSPYGSSKPEHFIVVKSKDGSDYVINDPFIENGMNIKFSSHYTIASLRTVDRVTVN